MLENLLRIIMREEVRSTPHNREEDGNDKNQSIVAAPHVIVKEAAVDGNTEFSILAEKFGELSTGKVINISLQELLNLIPRTRRRSDAYRGLQSQLERQGVTLNITSTRKKTNNTKENG